MGSFDNGLFSVVVDLLVVSLAYGFVNSMVFDSMGCVKISDTYTQVRR